LGKLICQGCRGSGENPYNKGGYCVCPKGLAKKAKDDLKAAKLTPRTKRKEDVGMK
jgi:hypothetical protein